VFLQTRLEDSPNGKARSGSAVVGLAAEMVSVAFERVHALLNADTFQLWRSAEGDGVVAGSARIKAGRADPLPVR